MDKKFIMTSSIPAWHGRLFNYRGFIRTEANDAPKLNSPTNIFSINPHIILHFFFSSNIYEYLKYCQPEYYYYQQKIYLHIHLVQSLFCYQL